MRTSGLSVCIVLALLLACGSKDPVSVLLADLEEAVEARDVDDIEKLLAVDFTGYEGMSRDEALSLMRRYFAAYEKISLDITNVERSKSGDRVNFRVAFSGQANAAFNLQNLLPSSAAYHFELRFANEANTLKVKKAFWNEISAL